MKALTIILMASLLVACSQKETFKYTKDVKIEGLKFYSEEVLLDFFDSISQLDIQQMKTQVGTVEEEQFQAIKPLDITLSDIDFATLKKAFGKNNSAWIELDLAKRIFSFPIDSTHIFDNSVGLGLFSFDENWNEFVIYIGQTPALGREHDIYFFKNNKIIAFQQNHHHMGIEINHFKDQENKTVVYYLENFSSGTGIWQYNYFFYRYNGNHIEPVLNVLQNGNVNESSYKTSWLEATIESTNPLTLKFVYFIYFPDVLGNNYPLVNDNATVTYNWDTKTQTLKGQFPSHLNENQIFAFYLNDNDSFMIRFFSTKIKTMLESKTGEKDAAFYFLNTVKGKKELSN